MNHSVGTGLELKLNVKISLKGKARKTGNILELRPPFSRSALRAPLLFFAGVDGRAQCNE